MPSDDDVSGLFAENPKGPALPATFRQAELSAFDADDGSNTVKIGTTELSNLRLLVTGAEIGLESGDNILVMYLGNTPMIVGKIASPGGPNYGQSAAGRTGFFLTVNSFGVPNAITTVLSGPVVVPGWANSVSITLTGTCNINNTGAAASQLTSEVRLIRSGFVDAFSDGMADTIGTTVGANLGGTHASFSDILNVTPGSVCTVEMNLFAAPAIPTNPNAGAWLSCRAEFYREAAAQ